MYEERFVDVASYVCHILDQIPAFPVSPMYVDWLIEEATEPSDAMFDTLITQCNMKERCQAKKNPE